MTQLDINIGRVLNKIDYENRVQLPLRYFAHFKSKRPSLIYSNEELKFTTDWNWLIPACKYFRDWLTERCDPNNYLYSWGLMDPYDDEAAKSRAKAYGILMFKLENSLYTMDFIQVLRVVKEIVDKAFKI